jgi:hypothetical protein
MKELNRFKYYKSKSICNAALHAAIPNILKQFLTVIINGTSRLAFGLATGLPVGVLFNQRLNYTRTESGDSAQRG